MGKADEQMLSLEQKEIRRKEQKIVRLFNRACVDYHLLCDGDRVLVALSGGKDSLELTRLLAQRSRIFKPCIEVEAAHVLMDNIPYETDRGFLQRFCDDLGIRLNILHSRFDESTDSRKTKCFLCSWFRRKALFEYAVANGFNKIALGHHQDDILVTLLMNMTFEGTLSSMPPLLRLDHYPLEVIRPMCLVPERLIGEFSEFAGFEKQKTPCPYEQQSRRSTMTDVFAQLEKINPEARHSMWRALNRSTPLEPFNT